LTRRKHVIYVISFPLLFSSDLSSMIARRMTQLELNLTVELRHDI